MNLLPPQPQCTHCELHEQVTVGGLRIMPRTVGMPGLLLPESVPPAQWTTPLIYVGPGPSWTDDQAGSPFGGKPGLVFRRVYVEGIRAHELATIYTLNAVRCHIKDGEPPKARHLKACSDWLRQDLHRILRAHSEATPIIVCFGGGPIKAVTHYCFGEALTQSRVFARNFQPTTFEERGVVLGGMFSPAYLLANPNKRDVVHDQNQLLLDVLRHDTISPADLQPQFQPAGPPPHAR